MFNNFCVIFRGSCSGWGKNWPLLRNQLKPKLNSKYEKINNILWPLAVILFEFVVWYQLPVVPNLLMFNTFCSFFWENGNWRPYRKWYIFIQGQGHQWLWRNLNHRFCLTLNYANLKCEKCPPCHFFLVFRLASKLILSNSFSRIKCIWGLRY